MKKLMTIIALLALSVSLAIAQNIPEQWNNAEYIFEGQVIKVETYPHPVYNGEICTSNYIKVNRVFKSNIAPDQIVVLIQYGGLIQLENGNFYSSTSNFNSIDINSKGTFFCKALEKGNILENPKTAQYTQLMLVNARHRGFGYDQNYQDHDNPGISADYANRQDFYNYLKKTFTGVTIPPTGANPEFDKNIFENIKKWEQPALKAEPVPQEPVDTLAMYKRTEEHIRLTKLFHDSIRSANRSKNN